MGGDACRRAARARRGAERRRGCGRSRRPLRELDRGRVPAAGPLRRGGRLQRHLLLRRGRLLDQHRDDPGHLLPVQPGQRALGDPAAGDARRGGHGLCGLRASHEQDLRVRRLRSEHERLQRRDPGLRPDDEHLGFRCEHAGPARVHGVRLRRCERQDLPGRRPRRRRSRQREGDDVGVRPCGEHVHHARADSACRRRLGLRRDRRPPLSGRRPRCARHGGGSGLGLRRRRQQLVAQGRDAEPDERRGQRRRERQALELRRRKRRGPDPDDSGLRPGDEHLGEWPEPERSAHARRRNGDRNDARGRRRVRDHELDRQDRGAGRG